MNPQDPNGSGRGSPSPFDVHGSRGRDERRGFGSHWSEPTTKRPQSPDLDSPANPYGAQDWDRAPRDDEDDEGLGETTTRRRRGAGEPSPYPRHQVAALGSKTRVVRDANGVPHIHAKEERDAYAALGFCMAQDRLAQMDLVRRAATGRLAEVYGIEQVRHDALVRTAGIARRAAASATLLQGVSREALAAFVGGVNAVCATPSGKAASSAHPVAPWTIADCLAIELYVAWTLGLDVWPAKLVLARILATAGLERARWISPTRLELDVADEERMALWRRIDPRIVDLLQDGGGASGSAFAIASERTGGGALLACDLHLPPRLPSALYLAHLEAPDLSVVGAALVGFPAILVGRNATCAWGLTPLCLDDADFVTEELDGIGNFRTEEGWRKLAARREVIRVRDGETVRLDVVDTKNGPLLSRLVEQLDGAREDGVRSVSVAVRWGVNSLSSSLAGWLALARSGSVRQVGDAAALLDRGPAALNLVAADSAGAVKHWMVGTTPSRSGEARLPVRGFAGEARWRGSNPVSPGSAREAESEGLIVATGEPSLPSGGQNGAVIGSPEHAFRARRIAQLLAAETPSVERCEQLQRDLLDLALVELLPLFRAAVARAGDAALERELAPLFEWDGEARADSVGCSLAYASAFAGLLPELFPEGRFATLSRDPSLGWSALVRILAAESSPWFSGEAERDACLVKSLRRGREALAARWGADPAGWTWGRIHPRIARPAPSEAVEPPAAPEERPAPGSPFTVEVGRFRLREVKFAVTRAPALRMVVDLATRRAKLVLAGVESASPENPHFADEGSTGREGELLELELGAVQEGDTVELMPG
jgi:penicillin G amidase